MKEVDRYGFALHSIRAGNTAVGVIVKEGFGEYVRHSDYARVVAERDAAVAELNRERERLDWLLGETRMTDILNAGASDCSREGIDSAIASRGGE